MAMEDGSASGLLFIDVDEKPLIPYVPIIKQERESSPDETLSNVKKVQERMHCSECSTYSTCSKEKLTRHIRRAHHGLNAFQCSMCEYSTPNSTRFAEHVNKHTGVKPYQCKHCPYRSVSKKYLKFHETKHSVCDKCGYLAKNLRALKKHLRDTGCQMTVTGNTYECVPCNHKFDHPLSLRMHQKLHKKCPYCSEAFCQSVLALHLTNEHGAVKVPVSRKLFKCAECEWNSNSKQRILLHMIHHPKQVLDGKIDVTPLIETGILVKDG